jgi:sigma-54 specific flagellar transcriptional regulator A
MTAPPASQPIHLVHAPGSPLATVVAMAHRVGASGANALIVGESGTGKEVLARLVHATGIAPAARFVAVACGGRDGAALEAELFGPGAGEAGGLLARARGGTLFLEDVGELPAPVQARLVRETFEPGATAPSIRLVGSSTRDLLPDVAAGRFRRDLYDSLSCRIGVPPLRDRRADILEVFDRCWSAVAGRRDVTSGARDVLREYPWPGNCGEIDACARRLAAATPPDEAVGAHDVERHLVAAATGSPMWAPEVPASSAGALELPELLRAGVAPALRGDPPAPIDLPAVLRRVEAGLVAWALERTAGNKAAAAELLCIRRTTLVEKIRRLRGGRPALPAENSEQAGPGAGCQGRVA